MPHPCLAPSDAPAIPLRLVRPESWEATAAELPEAQRRYADVTGFTGRTGETLALPAPDGGLAAVLVGLAPEPDPLWAGALPGLLPAGTFRFADPPPDAALATLAFLLGTYRFERYRARPARAVRLCVPDGVDGAAQARIADAVAFGRDLVNMPANDLGPDGIEDAARRLAERHGATVAVTTGDDLLDADLPLIHAVGRAADRAPRLVDITWGPDEAPRVTLVGKGVVFDTGGLDIKPASAMLLMKKDMGGAAAVLALADMVMGARLPLRLRVLVPAVENAIAGSSFRPGDVLRSRKGLSVEIGNTDAEGRLILADALALAAEEEPDLLVDVATLTGAARVALGPDLPALFTADDALAADLLRHGLAVADPAWRLPLWQPYAKGLESKIADLNNVTTGGFAGAVTAALFLHRFVPGARAHVHLDVYGWNPASRPGRPEGGEVQAARMVFAYLSTRFPAG